MAEGKQREGKQSGKKQNAGKQREGKQSARKRRHIGVLCSTGHIFNENDVWRGIVEVAEKNDVHVTAYIAAFPQFDYALSSHMESCLNNMLNSEHLDGVILMSGYLAQNIGLEIYDKYAERFPRDFPYISVSYEIPGIPSVMTYNRRGICNAVEHLITVHGKKQIAFIKGPDGHPEAEDRLLGYKDALERNGIPFDEKYVFAGDFGRTMAGASVDELYDARKIPVDAFACSNDQAVIGVLSALNARGILVPGEIAVTGFDDDVISSIYVPSISTVRQDFVQLGRVSTNLLLDRIDGKQVDEVTLVTPEFIGRQSCGCFEMNSAAANSAADADCGGKSFFPYIEKEFVKLLQGDVPQKQIKAWVASLFRKIDEEPFQKDAFLSELDAILVAYYHTYSKDFSPWHEAMIILENGLDTCMGDVKNAYALSTTLASAANHVYKIRLREEKRRENSLTEDRVLQRRMASALLLMFNADTLSDEIFARIPTLNMDALLVGIYSRPVKGDSCEEERVLQTVIGFDGDAKFNISHNSWSPMKFSDFSTIEGFDFDRERRTMFYQPLFFLDEEVGEMLLPFDPNIPMDTYETLRINISVAIKGANLMNIISMLSVTDELTGLYNRRGFFQFAYSRLKHLNRNVEAVPVVMFMDMDGLKQINDNYGHKEGDRAIEAFAEILKKTVREEDILGRMGGDEFATFSAVRSKENGKHLETRIRRALDDYNAKGLHPYKVAGSIGSVILDSATKECFDSAMLKADSVLYEEKLEKKKKGLART